MLRLRLWVILATTFTFVFNQAFAGDVTISEGKKFLDIVKCSVTDSDSDSEAEDYTLSCQCFRKKREVCRFCLEKHKDFSEAFSYLLKKQFENISKFEGKTNEDFLIKFQKTMDRLVEYKHIGYSKSEYEGFIKKMLQTDSLVFYLNMMSYFFEQKLVEYVENQDSKEIESTILHLS